MLKYLFWICLMLLMTAAIALGADNDPNALAGAAQTFLVQVMAYIHSFGGQGWFFKIASLTLLAIAIIKVTPLKDAIWTKLGKLQIWVAPLFGFVIGLASMVVAGVPINLPALLAYASAGAGAVYLHELLDLLKLIPGIGPFWVGIISVIEGALGGSGK